MYQLQVFRTKSKDYLEAFSKMEEFVKSNNSNVGSSISNESLKKYFLDYVTELETAETETETEEEEAEKAEDDQSEILRDTNWEVEDFIEDLSDVKEIAARICGCISQDNEIHNYPVEGRDNLNINEFSGHLNPSEWSISVLDKLFKDASGNKNFDILKDEWEVICETGLFDIDEGDALENQKCFFIIAYVREDD
jgi:hypothetical protein